MTYSFDSYGWLSETEIVGRTTSIEPPAHGAKEVGQPYPNWTGFDWVMVPYSEPVIPAPVVPRITRLTKLDYMNRFTDAELETIYGMESSVPAVKVWLAKFNATTPDPDGTSIDLDDPRTIVGVQTLEAAGILSAGRAQEILS